MPDYQIDPHLRHDFQPPDRRLLERLGVPPEFLEARPVDPHPPRRRLSHPPSRRIWVNRIHRLRMWWHRQAVRLAVGLMRWPRPLVTSRAGEERLLWLVLGLLCLVLLQALVLVVTSQPGRPSP